MARIATIENLVTRLMDGSCIGRAEFARVTAGGIYESIRYRNNRTVGKVRIDLNAESADDKNVRGYDAHDHPAEQNGLQLQGTIMCDGIAVPFYGSEAGFKRLKDMG